MGRKENVSSATHIASFSGIWPSNFRTVYVCSCKGYNGFRQRGEAVSPSKARLIISDSCPARWKNVKLWNETKHMFVIPQYKSSIHHPSTPLVASLELRGKPTNQPSSMSPGGQPVVRETSVVPRYWGSWNIFARYGRCRLEALSLHHAPSSTARRTSCTHPPVFFAPKITTTPPHPQK